MAPLKEHGMTVSDNQGKADILNRQYESVFTKENLTSIPVLDSTTYPEMPSISITNNGVYKLLDSINPNKAQGPDELPARVLKEAASEIIPILTEIYNKSLQTGIVPDDWRNANISPIFKKGEKHIAGNYRPVSLTSICCKHMENILVKHILEHLDNHSILKDCQHGFRSRRSCETQLITFVQELVDTMPGGGQTDILLMDFSKAFDKVPHQRLLRKLHHYGIRGDVLR